MTLKEYLISHNITATSNQRSKIGTFISKLEHDSFLINEDGCRVKCYEVEFLNSADCRYIIINTLSNTNE